MAAEKGDGRGDGGGDGGRAGSGRALVIHPALRDGDGARTPAARLAEACGLAEAIGLEVAQADVVAVRQPSAATLFGSGTVARIGEAVAAQRVEVAIVDGTLSPLQQRNLEQAWETKVLDRTGLILEIFGERARTREGQLQVELAALTYQRSRLVRSWTHLGRQRGGFGFLAGPGETQLETDRRLIDDRIAKLKRELEEVRRTRDLHRRARRRRAEPVVALVGYTNAGKSTLFNRLSGAAVQAEDMLFATLDPTMRAIALPTGRHAILADTVGFISDLPTQLVAAFRATLEEVRAADVILHIRDIAHPDTEAQRRDVLTVLAELGIDEGDNRLVEVLNKADLALIGDGIPGIGEQADGRVVVSAVTGAGLDDLMRLLDRMATGERLTLDLAIPLGDGATLAWLHEHGEVLESREDEALRHLRVVLSPADAARLHRRQAPPDDAPAPRAG